MTKQTIKQIKNFLWSKGYFIKGFNDSGIRHYRVWNLKTKEEIGIFGEEKLRAFYDLYYYGEQ